MIVLHHAYRCTIELSKTYKLDLVTGLYCTSVELSAQMFNRFPMNVKFSATCGMKPKVQCLYAVLVNNRYLNLQKRKLGRFLFTKPSQHTRTVHVLSVIMTLCTAIQCTMLYNVLYLGERGWRSVRALASHQCGPGSIPGLGIICGLSLLVLYSAPRGFSPGTPVFPSPQKPKFDLI